MYLSKIIIVPMSVAIITVRNVFIQKHYKQKIEITIFMINYSTRYDIFVYSR